MAINPVRSLSKHWPVILAMSVAADEFYMFQHELCQLAYIVAGLGTTLEGAEVTTGQGGTSFLINPDLRVTATSTISLRSLLLYPSSL